MHNKRTTRLKSNQFATLITALNQHLTWNKPATRPRALSLNQVLKITLMYLRPNLTEEVLPEAIGVSQSTISKTIHHIEGALLKLKELKTPALEPLQNIPGSLVMHGTLIPVRNWASQGSTLFSGKHKRTDYNHQVICTLGGKLLAITDPVAGARHDAYCFKEHGLEQYLDETTLADKGYVGLGLASPGRRSKARRLAADVKAVNRFINSRRVVVERGIA